MTGPSGHRPVRPEPPSGDWLLRLCPCRFTPPAGVERFTAGWYRAHRDHHLAVFPDADPTTRANLEMLVTLAGKLDEAGTR